MGTVFGHQIHTLSYPFNPLLIINFQFHILRKRQRARNDKYLGGDDR